MKILFYIFEKKLFIALAVCGLIIVLLEYLSIGIILPFVTLAAKPEIINQYPMLKKFFEIAGLSSFNNLIIAAAALLCLLFVIKNILCYVLYRMKAQIMSRGHRDLASRIMDYTVNADYRVFLERSPSEFVSTIQSLVEYSVLCLESVVNLLIEAILFALLLLLALWLNFTLTLIFTGSAIFLALLLKQIILAPLQRLGAERTEYNTSWHHLTFSLISAIRDIKIMGLNRQISGEFNKIAGQYTGVNAKYATLQATPKLLGELFFAIFLICGVVVVGLTGYDLKQHLPMLVTFGVIILRLLPSVQRIYYSISTYKYHSAGMWTLYGTMCYLQKNYLKVEMSADEKKFTESVKLEDVSYTYPGSTREALTNVSLELPVGKFIGVIGRSGSGKSTFLDIITGMLQANSGKFYLDRRQFDPFKSDTLRRMMGYVPQQVTLMDDTIGFNIALSADWQEHLDGIRQAAAAANIAGFVESIDEEYSADAGERGVKMSGGQRQRIGIARALYQNPEILVFDEATSSLDALTEQEIMDSINAIAGGKTIIFATHRMQTVQNCDVIILFDQGRIAASGTHLELLENNQLYHDILSRKEYVSQ